MCEDVAFVFGMKPAQFACISVVLRAQHCCVRTESDKNVPLCRCCIACCVRLAGLLEFSQVALNVWCPGYCDWQLCLDGFSGLASDFNSWCWSGWVH